MPRLDGVGNKCAVYRIAAGVEGGGEVRREGVEVNVK